MPDFGLDTEPGNEIDWTTTSIKLVPSASNLEKKEN